MSAESEMTEGTAVAAADTSPSKNDARDAQQALLAYRRRWHHSFPTGSLEFVAVVRLTATLALFALPILNAGIRYQGIRALILLFLVDAGLVTWWVTRMAGDRHSWLGPVVLSPRQIARRAATVVVPVLAAQGLLLSFALSYVPGPLATIGSARWVLLAGFGVAAIVTAWQGRQRLGGAAGSLLLAFPILNAVAVRRYARRTVHSLLNALPAPTGHHAPLPTAGLVIADVFGSLLVLAVLATLANPDAWTGFSGQAFATAMLFALAAIADVAAMEAPQRGYLEYLRKA